MPLPTTRTLLLRPGFLCVPCQPTRLCTVIASGIAVTVYDRRQCFGGIGHFSHPRRIGRTSTPDFAAPALVGLFRIFVNAGSRLSNLETYIYGGADNPEAPGYVNARGMLNSHAGFEILSKLGVRIAGSDVGGRFARKLIFYSGTGESVLAKVTDTPHEEWYPEPAEVREMWA